MKSLVGSQVAPSSTKMRKCAVFTLYLVDVQGYEVIEVDMYINLGIK